ncbi:MAG: TonB-dependent receptor [Candidatus Hatepunaea meridiana]|nr:TonB-dependent receptor [Candidatus Hatepunaea meridiana]
MPTYKINNLKSICLIVVLISAVAAFSQIKPSTIKGKVLDRSTRAAVVSANIVILSTDFGAATDLDGSFKIVGIPPGTYSLQATALGYIGDSKSDIAVLPGRSVNVEFLLEPTAIKGEEVVVTGGFFRPKPDLVTSSRSLRYEEIRRAPGSAEDVQRVIQALPGIANSNDQNNEIIVRGGSPSENLLVMDGVEIDNINHFPEQASSGGPIGLVNTEFLREVTFASGGFSARYGDRLSSVLDLELREGDREQFSGQIETSMAGLGVNLEGGLAGEKGSYLVSFRKSYLDLIQGPIGLTSIPHYWDTQFKVAYDLSPLDKLSLIGLYGRDWISISVDDEDAWSRGAEAVDVKGYNLALGLKWRKVWRGGYTDVVLARTEINHNYEVFEVNVDRISNARSRRLFFLGDDTETNHQLHANWTGRIRKMDEISAGLSLKPITFIHDEWLAQDTTYYDDINNDGIQPDTVFRPERIIDESTTSLKYGGFIQYRWRPLNRLTLVGGVRLDGFQYSEQATVAPRLSASWDVLPKLTLKAAYGIYYQSHPLIIYTYDPGGANKTLPHPRAAQYVGGLSYLLTNSTLLSVEGYYKDYCNLVVYEQKLREDDNPAFRSWRYLAVGRKWSSGIEFFAQQKLATNWYGSLSYSYGESNFDDSQETYSSDYDYRHIGTMVLGYKFSGLPMRSFQKHWYGWWTNVLPVNGDEMTLSTRYRYVSGRPYTGKEWTLRGLEYYEHWENYVQTNGSRYPDYNRLDVRLDSKWFFGSKSIICFLEVENLLDRKNVAQYVYADDGEMDIVYQFRFFFVGGIRFEW